MSIFKKIAEIQCELLPQKFPTIRGYHGEYIPLNVMLPHVIRACSAKELTLYFTSTNEHLMLKLMSWDGKDEFSARVRLPELTQDEKKEGAKITYLKRYLLMNVFMILEDGVDPDNIPDNQPINEKVTPEQINEEKVNINVGLLIAEAENRLHDKDVEVTGKALKQQVLHLKKWTVPERRVILNYFKENQL